VKPTGTLITLQWQVSADEAVKNLAHFPQYPHDPRSVFFVSDSLLEIWNFGIDGGTSTHLI